MLSERDASYRFGYECDRRCYRLRYRPRRGATEIVRRDARTGKETTELAPIVHIDAILRIVPPAAGEIEHEKIRELIYRFQGGGVAVKSVSMDQWSRAPN